MPPPSSRQGVAGSADARNGARRATHRCGRHAALLPLQASVLVLLRAGRSDEVERRPPGRAGAATPHEEEGGDARRLQVGRGLVAVKELFW